MKTFSIHTVFCNISTVGTKPSLGHEKRSEDLSDHFLQWWL